MMHMAIWHMAYVRGVYPRKKIFESNPLTTRARLQLFADGRIRTCAGEAYLISKLSLKFVEFNVQKIKKNAPHLKIIFFFVCDGKSHISPGCDHQGVRVTTLTSHDTVFTRWVVKFFFFFDLSKTV